MGFTSTGPRNIKVDDSSSLVLPTRSKETGFQKPANIFIRKKCPEALKCGNISFTAGETACNKRVTAHFKLYT